MVGGAGGGWWWWWWWRWRKVIFMSNLTIEFTMSKRRGGGKLVLLKGGNKGVMTYSIGPSGPVHYGKTSDP